MSPHKKSTRTLVHEPPTASIKKQSHPKKEIEKLFTPIFRSQRVWPD